MSASSSTRPVTSKSRGVCRYYTTPRGCFAQDRCKFLHAEPPNPTDGGGSGDAPPLLTPYDKAKRCRYYSQGFCKRGEACWFLHATDKSASGSSTRECEEEELCSICFEKPTTYGLLGGCSHIFCTTCIKQWRDPLNKPGGVVDSGNTKKCPMCRTPSKFITPSSRFWRDGTPEKEAVTLAYKESMARVPCRYFQKSLQKNKDKPICPYGKDCFYQHLKEDGTPYVFKNGVDVCMRKYNLSQRRGHFFDNHFMPFSLDLSSLDIVIPGHGLHFLPSSAVREADTANTVSTARTRLRDVGRSLEMLNQAIGDGAATTDRLSSAVEALRAGLGRLEGLGNVDTPNARRRGDGDSRMAEEEDIMQRLEILMMASLNARQVLIDAEEQTRAGTPPPPLEAVADAAGQDRWARDSDNDSMPGLYSVSNSSEDDDEDDEEDDDDDDYDEDMSPEEAMARFMAGRAAMNEWFAGHAATDAVEDDEDDDEPPPLEEPVEAAAAEDVEPPFVTDGRGRVVWSREDKSNEGTPTPEEPAGSSSSSSGNGTGRSFLDWFHSLF